MSEVPTAASGLAECREVSNGLLEESRAGQGPGPCIETAPPGRQEASGLKGLRAAGLGSPVVRVSGDVWLLALCLMESRGSRAPPDPRRGAQASEAWPHVAPQQGSQVEQPAPAQPPRWEAAAGPRCLE